MGTRGPLPKRPENRRRRNVDESAPVTEVDSTFSGQPAVEPNPAWPHKVMQLWDTAATSAHTIHYEPSDWAQLYAVLDDYAAAGSRPSAGVMKEVYAALGDLMFSEGARRRANLIIKRDNEDQLESLGMAEVEKFITAFGVASDMVDQAND